MMTERSPRPDVVSLKSGIEPRDAVMSRRLAGLLGFCLPLGGGLSLDRWIPNYPNEVTVIRLVTFIALLWIACNQRTQDIPRSSRRMIQGVVVLFGYALISAIWAPDATHALNDIVAVGIALSTAIVLLLLVRDDKESLRGFGIGVLTAAVVQVAIAVSEVLTGNHVVNRFSDLTGQWDIAQPEALYGPVAFGTLANPNDLGGFWLLAIALFLGGRAFGIARNVRHLVVGVIAFATAVAIGLTSLSDARAFRWGLAVLVIMCVLELVFPSPSGGAPRPVVVILALATAVAIVAFGPTAVNHLSDTNNSDAVRRELFIKGLSTAFESGGFGRGIGSESAMIESGEIPTNFHNFIAQVSAELGFLVLGALVLYLLGIVLVWVFGSGSVRAGQQSNAFAKACIVVSLIVYSFTSSGVLESPIFWTFFGVTALLAEGSEHTARRPAERQVGDLRNRSRIG